MPLVLWVWSGVSRGTFDLEALLVSAFLPTVAAVSLGWFRLRIDDSGIEYRDLIRSFYVSYPEVASLKTEWISGGRFWSVGRTPLFHRTIRGGHLTSTDLRCTFTMGVSSP